MPSSSTLDLPVIDFGVYLEDPTSTAALEECKKVRYELHPIKGGGEG